MEKALDEIKYVYFDLYHPKNITFLSKFSIDIGFKENEIKLDELPSQKYPDRDIETILRIYKLDKYIKDYKQLPKYMFNKIENARRFNRLDETMRAIHGNLTDYLFLFSEREAGEYLNTFFNKTLDLLLKSNLHVCITTKNKKHDFFPLKRFLLSNDEFKINLKQMIHKFGLPFLSNSIKRYKINLDDFIISGILIAVLKRLLYVDYNCNEELKKFLNTPNINNSNLSNLIDKKIYQFYIKNVRENYSCTTIEKLELEKETKTAMQFLNLFDFYYHYFSYHYENDTRYFKDLIRNEEVECIKNYYINAINISRKDINIKQKRIKSINRMTNNDVIRKYRRDIKDKRI